MTHAFVSVHQGSQMRYFVSSSCDKSGVGAHLEWSCSASACRPRLEFTNSIHLFGRITEIVKPDLGESLSTLFRALTLGPVFLVMVSRSLLLSSTRQSDRPAVSRRPVPGELSSLQPNLPRGGRDARPHGRKTTRYPTVSQGCESHHPAPNRLPLSIPFLSLGAPHRPSQIACFDLAGGGTRTSERIPPVGDDSHTSSICTAPRLYPFDGDDSS